MFKISGDMFKLRHDSDAVAYLGGTMNKKDNPNTDK